MVSGTMFLLLKCLKYNKHEKNHQITFALLAALSLAVSSCGPNDDQSSDDKARIVIKKGAIDSTKIPISDSTKATDSFPTLF